MNHLARTPETQQSKIKFQLKKVKVQYNVKVIIILFWLSM